MTKIAVVGGGLAGMVAALRLQERGCQVTIFEASDRLGGKAGANPNGASFDEHGYHIFPDWYKNAQELARELGLTYNFIDCTDFFQLEPGAFPTFKRYQNITSWRYAWSNMWSGVLPFFEAGLFYYAALDLMSQPYQRRAQLDQVTVSGFLRSRSYRTERLIQQFQELMLKGISVPTYEVSAMTMRNVMRFWVRSPEPMMRILKGNLQQLWIEPLQARLVQAGVALRLGRQLVRIEPQQQRIARLHFVTATGDSEVETIDPAQHLVVMAIPAEKMAALISDELYAADPDLARIKYLRARPMAALNLYLSRKLEGLPRGHINLLGSTYGISLIDVSQLWPDCPATVLNAIASDVLALEGLSTEMACRELMKDLRRYLDIGDGDISQMSYQDHLQQPLFMNNVGNWAYRPEAKTKIANLYLAGDYCRSAIDLVCMEGALSTGLLAAQAIAKAIGTREPVTVRVPPQYPTWLFRLGKVAGWPLAELALLGAYISARLRGERLRDD